VLLESAFQASKVFSRGGPYRELLAATPREAKGDPRLRSSGLLVGFQWEERRLPSRPATAFYDWLYIKALGQMDERVREDVTRVPGKRRLRDRRGLHPLDDDRRGGQVASVRREDPAHARRTDAVAGATDPLQPRSDRRRGFELDDDIVARHFEHRVDLAGDHLVERPQVAHPVLRVGDDEPEPEARGHAHLEPEAVPSPRVAQSAEERVIAREFLVVAERDAVARLEGEILAAPPRLIGRELAPLAVQPLDLRVGHPFTDEPPA
jgi:hypothetical protein